MMDPEKREKVIRGLIAIISDDRMWREADYYATVCKDALLLLKAQEPIAIPMSWLTEMEYGDDVELSAAANTVVKAWLMRKLEGGT